MKLMIELVSRLLHRFIQFYSVINRTVCEAHLNMPKQMLLLSLERMVSKVKSINLDACMIINLTRVNPQKLR